MISAVRRLTWVAMLAAVAPAMACAQASLTVEGTEFVLTTAKGRTLRSADLQGATLKIEASGSETEVTIRSVEEDPRAVGGRVLLHHFVVKDDSGHPVNLCAPDAQGHSLGFPVPDSSGGFDLTCTSGAVGKCIRWGYRPWEEAPGGPPLRALHEACVHMARADYGGDGVPTTRDGTMIDLYDRFGIQVSDRSVPMSFEAAWGVDGAICVAHPRIPENISLEELGARYPRLRGSLGPAACTEEGAIRDPRALLFNRSPE
jgi:ADYC domain